MTEAELLKKALFVPCTTKEALHRWIKVYLGLDLPDCTVHEDSTSNPMALIWEIYDKCQRNDVGDITRLMAYASRDSYKTVIASILETLAILHLDRPVVHLAAILQQSKKSSEYVKSYFNRPYIRDFKLKENERQIEYVRYYDPNSGDSITQKQWESLSEATQGIYQRKAAYIQIIVATMASTNSAHVPLLVVDECIDGDSKILVKSARNGKFRHRQTAKSLFLALKGENPSGNRRKKPEEETIVPIRQIEVLSMDLENGTTLFKPVTAAKVSQRDCLKVVTDIGKHIVCTDNHPLFVLGRGYVKASEILVGDSLIALEKSKTPTAGLVRGYLPQNADKKPYVSPECIEWEQVLLGSLMGDCGIYKKKQNNPYLSEQHCMKQKEYLQWKMEVLGKKFRTYNTKPRSGYTGQEQVGFRTGCSVDLLSYKDIRNNLNGMEKIEGLGLCVWYMDDGCAGNGFRLSTEGWGEAENIRIRDFLNKRFDLDVGVFSYKKAETTFFCIRGGVGSKRRLYEICKSWIHPTMRYKFDIEKNKGVCECCNKEFWFYESRSCPSPICRNIGYGKRFSLGKVIDVQREGAKTVYDFTVKDNHNFFANGLLVHNCDVMANPRAYEEAKMIPAPWEGRLPVTLLTSTRKFSYGIVQSELDEAAKTGLAVRHWNIIDVTEACPPSRHQPELPKAKLWVNSDEIRHVSDDEYKKLDSETQAKFVQKEGFGGCAKCPLFAACQTRLATNQKCKSKLLKPIDHTINVFKAVSIPVANAQLLCFSGTTKILMHDGTMKPIDQVVVGDLVIAHTGAVRRVVETMSRDFDGDVAVFRPPTMMGHFMSTVCSKEHPFFVNGENFEEIGKLKPWSFYKCGSLSRKGDYLSLPSQYVENNVSEIKISDIVKDSIELNGDKVRSTLGSGSKWTRNVFNLDFDFGWMIGYFAAEGWVSYRKYREKSQLIPYSVTFASDSREQEFHERVRIFFAKSNTKVQEYKSKQSEHGYTQRVYGRLLTLFFENLVGRFSDKKRLRADLMYGQKPFLKGILEGFNAGDGTKSNGPAHELVTTSESLSSQLFLIAARLGLNPRISKRKPPKGTQKQAFVVRYRDEGYIQKQSRTKFIVKDNFNLYRFSGYENKPFSGKLYNLEIEHDNSYIADGVAVHNCFKPDTSGLVYPHLTKDHLRTADQIYQMATGDAPKSSISKQELLQWFFDNGGKFYSGMDFGFTHDFAVTTGVVWGNYLFVLDVIMVAKLELDDKIQACQKIKHLQPVIFGDPESPSDITTFRKKGGFKMRKWSKGPNSVKAGIETVRAKLRPAIGKPTLFFLKDDEAIGRLFAQLEKYHFKTDAAGEITDEPAKENDDGPDSLRYLVMNVFTSKGAVLASFDNDAPLQSGPQIVKDNSDKKIEDEMKKIVAQYLESPIDELPSKKEEESKRSKFVFDI